MTDSSNQVASFSSRGNVGIGIEGQLGRFVDVVAPGRSSSARRRIGLENDVSIHPPLSPILRDLNDNLGDTNGYRFESGTSFAVPVVSGMVALLQEFFEQRLPAALRRTNSPALMKALLIYGARNVNPEIYDLHVRNTINHQGWGLVNLTNSLPLALEKSPEKEWPVMLYDQSPTNALATGQSRTWRVQLSTNAQEFPLRVTLVWTDPPGNPNVRVKLVNDLDLVVTNEESGMVFYGNNIPVSSDFTPPSEPGEAPVRDMVNNVENIIIREPFLFGSNYTVTVKGRRVNVNAVSDYHWQQRTNAARLATNDVVQDYALVIGSGNVTLTNAFTLAEAPKTNNPVELRGTTTLTNGVPLMQERVGANPSLIVTNGMTNQWNFYVFTNVDIPNNFGSLTAGQNVAFVTFVPPNLSLPRNLEADIDLFVSTNSLLLKLDPMALSETDTNIMQKSVDRGGTEFVVFNGTAKIGDVFYVAVKSEDQQASEFSLITISTDLPFETGDENNRYLQGFPFAAVIPDGFANSPGGVTVMAIGLSPQRVASAIVTNIMFHENWGDLIGNLSHYRRYVVLNNHTNWSGTNTIVYDDPVEEPYRFLPQISQPTDGPGSLQNFVGERIVGPWILQMVDNAPTHTGQVVNMSLFVRPLRQLLPGVWTPGKVEATNWVYYVVDVPPGVTNMIVKVDNPALELYVRRGALPTRTIYDARGTNVGGGLELQLGIYDTPPLVAGQYIIGVYNPTASQAAFNILVLLEYGFVADRERTLTYLGPHLKVLDDAVTTTSFVVTDDRQVTGVRVGVRLDDNRESDLVLHLVSPQGTRIVLAENRGGFDTNGFGSGSIVTNTARRRVCQVALRRTQCNREHEKRRIIIVAAIFSVSRPRCIYYDGALIYDTGLINGQGNFRSIMVGQFDECDHHYEQGNNSDTNGMEYQATIVSGRYKFAALYG